MNKLTKLAERVEALTGPCRETDKAILLAFGYSWRGMAYWFRDDSRTWKGDTHFTASLDAAMTLVPDAHRITLYVTEAGSAVMLTRSNGEWIVQGRAATPALALTAAALRARAAMGGAGDTLSLGWRWRSESE